MEGFYLALASTGTVPPPDNYILSFSHLNICKFFFHACLTAKIRSHTDVNTLPSHRKFNYKKIHHDQFTKTMYQLLIIFQTQKKAQFVLSTQQTTVPVIVLRGLYKYFNANHCHEKAILTGMAYAQ